MTTSKTARDLAGWNTDLAKRIDEALDDRYRRGYDNGRREAFGEARRLLDQYTYPAIAHGVAGTNADRDDIETATENVLAHIPKE